ncbi:Transposase IS200 like protein [compost metagenome]
MSFFVSGLSQLSTRSVGNKNQLLCGWCSQAYSKKPPDADVIIELFKLLCITKGKGDLMANRSDMSHTKWMCKYHIVFTPKYRRKAIYNQYKESIRDILKQLCNNKGVEILEGHLMPDHIHMLVSIPPKMSVSSFMGYLKGKRALMIFDKHANLKYKYGNRHFWAEGYYVSTVGLNEATIRKYIQEQESHDIALDKLSVKEYENPFKG